MFPLPAALPFFEIGPIRPIPGVEAIQFHSFGLLVAFGALVGLWMGGRRARRKLDLDGDLAQLYGVWVVASGWVFSHVLNVVLYRPHLIVERPLALLAVWESASSYGGLVGAIVGGLLWYWYWSDREILLWADLAVWMSIFGWMFGRLGCASAHDHLGAQAPETWPLAFEIPAKLGGGVRHDLGFYEFLWWVVIVAVAIIIDRQRHRHGIFVVVVSLLYAPVRFVLDFFRLWPVPAGDSYDVPAFTQFVLDVFGAEPESLVLVGNRLYHLTAPIGTSEFPATLSEQGMALFANPRYFGLTPAQYFSIALFVLGLVVWWRIRERAPFEWQEYRDEE